MCGFHHHNGTPIGHSHRPVFRPRPRFRSRRAFLGELGRNTIAMAVVVPILAACGDDDDGTASPSPSTAAGSETETTTTLADEAESDGAAATSGTDQASGTTDDELRWARANLGFVSAYVLARGNRAAIVDTGVEGSANAIGETLQTLGLNYDDVDHVILTHKHADHAGSTAEVMAMAASATVYAGEADLSAIDVDGITGVLGGEEVFGLELVATPGHTAGHLCAIDHTAGLLVAGDALFTDGGGVVEGPEQFFEDVPRSRQSIRELAALSFNTLLVGHGDPIEGNADTAVVDLAASLP